MANVEATKPCPSCTTELDGGISSGGNVAACFAGLRRKVNAFWFRGRENLDFKHV